MATRDEIRTAILGTTHKPKSKTLMFFGVEIELRQATMGDILEAQADPDRKNAIVSTLVGNAYVPGTDEKVFEDTDVPVLLKLPFGKDLIEVSNALEELTEVNFREAKVATEAPTS